MPVTEAPRVVTSTPLESGAQRAGRYKAAHAALEESEEASPGAWGALVKGCLEALGDLPEGAARAGALLVKTPKAGQDLRADMPAIGPETIRTLVEKGLAGVVIDAGQVILLDRDETLRRARDAGLVLWSRRRD